MKKNGQGLNETRLGGQMGAAPELILAAERCKVSDVWYPCSSMWRHRPGSLPAGPHTAQGFLRFLLSLLLALSAVGCNPTLDVIGVYFPAWLVSSVAGLTLAYLAIWRLGHHRPLRQLAQSGLFFLSLTVSLSFAVWWLFFRGT
jgi:hypothetical protein